MEYLGFFIALTLASSQAVLGSRLGAENDHITRREGQNVTLSCSFMKEGIDLFDNPVIWEKVVGDGGADVAISLNRAVQPPFVETGRYSLKTERRENGITLDLVIDDIEVVDNGTYRCKLGNLKEEEAEELPPVNYTVIVPVALDDLTLTNSNVTMNGAKMTFVFKSLEPTPVSCQSIGGNPRPKLTLSRGDQIITSEFTLETREERTGPRGLQHVTHHVKLVSSDFRAEPDMSGQELKCAAKFPRLHDLRQSTKGIMDVMYAPEFECQPYRTLKMPIDIDKYVIDCVIKGNPPVESRNVVWTFKQENRTMRLAAGDILDSYATNSSLTPENHLNVALMITGVNETHFNTYHIEASNPVNQEHFEIYFGEATTTTTTTTTTTVKPPEVLKPGEGAAQGGGEVKASHEESAGNSVHVTGNHVLACAALAYLLQQVLGFNAQR